MLALADGDIDLDAAVVKRAGRVLRLTPLEVRLLTLLAERAGAVVSREVLARALWGRAADGKRPLDNLVRRIREKIEVDPKRPEHLVVAYGLGVRLTVGTARRGAPFVGRDDELRALLEALRSPSGLVTVCGPAGSGKTRLVREGAAQAELPLIAVSLTGARTADDALRAVALALGASPATDAAVSAARAARGPHVLLLDDAPAGLELPPPSDVPDGRVVYSRRSGAASPRITLGPLPPDAAERLFREAVAATGPGAPVPPVGDPDVAALVCAVDHLPLAIEVLAARATAVPPADLRARLDRRLDLASAEDRPLRRAIDASLALLPPQVREAARALAVFVGPFTIADAEQVLGAPAVEPVGHLVESNLAFTVPDPHRCCLYAVARDRLWELEPPPPEAIARHGSWFAHLAERATSAVDFRRLSAAFAEVQAAFERAETLDPALAARCGFGLVRVCSFEGPLALAESWLDRVRHLPGVDPTLVAWRSADLAMVGGRPAQALAWVEGLGCDDPTVALALATCRVRALGRLGRGAEARDTPDDPRAAGWARAAFHRACSVLYDPVDEADRFEDHLRRGREAAAGGPGSDDIEAWSCVVGLAVSYRDRGRFRESAALFAEAEALPNPSRRNLAIFRYHQAELWRIRGSLEAASAELDRAERLAREMGAVAWLLPLAVARARIRWQGGDPAAGEADLVRALSRATASTWEAEVALADLALAAGDLDAARDALRRVADHPVAARMRRVHRLRVILDAFDGTTPAPPEPGAASDRLDPLDRAVCWATACAAAGATADAERAIAEVEAGMRALALGPASELGARLALSRRTTPTTR
ncbi:MAG: winged helix-turn-helix domain-containing protein [Myxococcota bacterium]